MIVRPRPKPMVSINPVEFQKPEITQLVSIIESSSNSVIKNFKEVITVSKKSTIFS